MGDNVLKVKICVRDNYLNVDKYFLGLGASWILGSWLDLRAHKERKLMEALQPLDGGKI